MGRFRATGPAFRRVGRVLLTSTITGTLLTAALPAAAGAQATTTCNAVVASGLTSPRFITVGPDNTVYISEGGSGGSEALPVPPGMPPGTPAGNRGTSGQITRVAPNGTKSVLAANLPSYFSPAEGAVGPSGLAVANGSLWALVGGAGPNYPNLQPLPNEASLLRVNLANGAVTKVADLGAYEKANNPGGFAVDTDPYGLGVAADGTMYAADAGGNTVYRVSPTGQLSVAAVIPGLPLPPGAPFPPGGNPARGGASEIDPVPTGVAVGPDGAVYVGLLSGFPFPQGGARVVRLGANGTTTDVARGLTMVVGVAVGPDRNVYVSEISTNFNATANPPQIAPGRVSRILPDGRTQVVADGLTAPNGIAFDRAGNLYVITGSAFGPPSGGQVVRCDRVAGPAAGLPATGSPVAPSRSLPATLGWAAAAVASAGAAALWAARRRLTRSA